MMSTVTLTDIKKAQERLGSIPHRTPLDCSRTFSEMTGGKIYTKQENLQKTGSFKLRGALNKIMTLSPEESRRGVIAASAGNHAQGVAFAATAQEISSVIVMPEGAPLAKAAATKSYGAEVILFGKTYDDAYAHAKKIQEEEKLTFIHAFNDPFVIAGQGTIGLEILEELPDLDTLVVPMGGGGLAAGMAVAVKEMNPKIRIIGVQSEGAPALSLSFQQGTVVGTEEAKTIADGIAVKQPGDLTFELIRRYVDEVVTVSEAEIARAILLMLERSKLIVEGAGAVSLAATLFGKIKVPKGPLVSLISGGNIDVNAISRIIERGLMESGRRVRLAILVPDQPGNLCRLLDIVAQHKANVVQVYHALSSESVDLGVVDVDLILETRDPQHCEDIVRALDRTGFSVKIR